GLAIPATDEAETLYPTMMVEVSYSQSTSNLHQVATLYLSQ
ncbi:4066_t:CDS:1, partial [Funneliformis caledonium]